MLRLGWRKILLRAGRGLGLIPSLYLWHFEVGFLAGIDFACFGLMDCRIEGCTCFQLVGAGVDALGLEWQLLGWEGNRMTASAIAMVFCRVALWNWICCIHVPYQCRYGCSRILLLHRCLFWPGLWLLRSLLNHRRPWMISSSSRHFLSTSDVAIFARLALGTVSEPILLESQIQTQTAFEVCFVVSTDADSGWLQSISTSSVYFTLSSQHLLASQWPSCFVVGSSWASASAAQSSSASFTAGCCSCRPFQIVYFSHLQEPFWVLTESFGPSVGPCSNRCLGFCWKDFLIVSWLLFPLILVCSCHSRWLGLSWEAPRMVMMVI